MGVLGADKAGVGSYRLAHSLERALDLCIELPPYHLAETLTQSLGLLPELGACLAASREQYKEPQTGDKERCRYPRHVSRRRRGNRHRHRPKTQSADLDRRRLGDSALKREGKLLRFVLAVVAPDHLCGVLADGPQELAPVELEVVADLPDNMLVVLSLPAAVDVLDDGSPLFQVPVDHPVY